MPSESKPLILDCKAASEAISRSREEKLPVGLRLKLQLHLLFCDACSRFSRFMEKTARILRHEEKELIMPEAMKQSIIKKLG